MRFIHTSDWHLGKVLKEQSLLEDQRYMLNQLIEIVEKEQPDAVIIAGDLYDQSIPSAEAIKLLDQVLHRLVIDLKTPVLAIAGNHDSAERTGFGNRLMQATGYHIVGSLREAFQPVMIEDEYGPVQVFLLPYATLGLVRDYFQLDQTPTYREAYELMITTIQEKIDSSLRAILVTHAFVTPGGVKMEPTSDSERQLTAIGGMEQVPSEIFDTFHYVALGHLHREMMVSNPKIRYSGSPLKYSISEEHHQKGFQIVELDANGGVQVCFVPTIPLRDLKTVEGYLHEILEHDKSEDYVFIKLLDPGLVLDAMERIRSVYPKALHVGRVDSRRELSETLMNREDVGHKSPIEIITNFYTYVQGQELDEASMEIMKELLEELFSEERVETV